MYSFAFMIPIMWILVIECNLIRRNQHIWIGLVGVHGMLSIKMLVHGALKKVLKGIYTGLLHG